MFILKTSPQQSYAFKEGISFAHFWICLLLFFIKTYCHHTGGTGHHFVFVILCKKIRLLHLTLSNLSQLIKIKSLSL